MDRKSFIVLALSFFLLVVVWPRLVEQLYPPKPLPQGTNIVAGATNTPPSPTTNVPAAIAPPKLTAAVPAPTESRPKGRERTEVLENEDARYTFTSHGGGLKLVEMKEYPASISSRRDAATAGKALAGLNVHAPRPVLDLLGGDAVQGDGDYQLTKVSATSLRAVKVLTNGLEISKHFQLQSNHLLTASVTFRNTSAEGMILPPHEIVVGTAAASGPKDDPMMTGVYWYNGARMEEISEGWFANRTFGCGPSNPRTEYEGGASNVVWSAAHNQFFALVVMPKEPAPKFHARSLDLPPIVSADPTTKPQNGAQPKGYQTSFHYPSQTLASNGEIRRQFEFYAGPKEYNNLARLGSQRGNNLDLVMKLNGFFGFFSKLLLLSMNALHEFGLSYGWSIIVITVVIKLLFWPLTNASTKSMKRMAALQPEMKALQEKYKDDPKKMNLKLMEFMKEHKVSPLGGCLPMLLQMPVFFGFFFMIKSAIELRGAQFLWANDLSSSDTIWILPGLNFPINPMPLLMGVTMFFQARMTPPSPGMDPVQQKIMKYMPLMFMVFLYNFSAGLTLYWTVQNLLTIAQMKLTKSDNAAAPGTPGPGVRHPAASPDGPGAKKKKR